MSMLSLIKTRLEADATLLASATGGIYDFDETGRMGINRTNTPAAFDSNGIIKPCVLLRLRSSVPDGYLADDPTQYRSLRENIECWFYQDSGYTTIETMRNRVYALLHARPVTGAMQLYWTGDVRGERDTDIDASVERSDFQAVTYRSS